MHAALRAVVPSAGGPGSRVSLLGSYVGQIQTDCAPDAFGESNCLGAVLLGDNVCQQQEGNIESVIEFGDSLGPAWSLRYGTWQYRLNCTTPAPDAAGNAKVRRPAPVRAGSERALLLWAACSLPCICDMPRHKP